MRRLMAFLRSGRGLPSFAAAVLGWMVLVILWGSVVRATGSGAGCGDHWPLCNGDFFPHHPRLATVIEFAHRSMSGVCTALVAALIAWTFLAQPRGSRVRKAAVWSGVLLLTEALLGAVLVLGGFVERNTSDMRVLVQSVHLTNTLLLLGVLSLAWWWQRSRPELPRPELPRPEPPGTARGEHPRARALAAAALAFTILTGATGSIAALADTLFPSTNLRNALLADLSSSSPLLVRMRWIHPAASLLAIACIAALAFTLPRRRAQLLAGLIGLQIVLGVADVLALAPIYLQVLHLLGADLLWIALVILASEVLSRRHDPGDAASATNARVAEPLLVTEGA